MRTQLHYPVFLLLAITGCDAASTNSSTLRGSIEDALGEANITLAEAVGTAVAEAGGVAIDAELDIENQTTVFDVEVYGDAGLTRVAVDVQDGSIVRVRDEGTDAEDAADATLASGVDWSVLIAAAEAEVGGTAFELKADDGELEVEVLAADGVWEIELAADGTILKVEPSDDDDGDDDGLDDDFDDDDDDDIGDDDDDDDDHHGGDDDDSDDDSDDSDDDSDDDDSDDDGNSGSN